MDALYREGSDSSYWYRGGINRLAVGVSVVSVVGALLPALGVVSPFSWFVGAGLAAVLYWALARRASSVRDAPARGPKGRRHDSLGALE